MSKSSRRNKLGENGKKERFHWCQERWKRPATSELKGEKASPKTMAEEKNWIWSSIWADLGWNSNEVMGTWRPEWSAFSIDWNSGRRQIVYGFRPMPVCLWCPLGMQKRNEGCLLWDWLSRFMTGSSGSPDDWIPGNSVSPPYFL